MKKCIITLVLPFLLFLSVTPNLLNAAPVQYPANGHYYDFITVVGAALTWEQARDYAAGLSHNGWQGHLVTVTSSGENNFVESLILIPPDDVDIWIGGYQLPNQSQPDVGWRWITGEPWSFNDWGFILSGEPNDWPSAAEDNQQNYVRIEHREDGNKIWGDEGSDDAYQYLIVEYEPAEKLSIPTMSEWGIIIMSLLLAGTAIWMMRRRQTA